MVLSLEFPDGLVSLSVQQFAVKFILEPGSKYQNAENLYEYFIYVSNI